MMVSSDIRHLWYLGCKGRFVLWGSIRNSLNGLKNYKVLSAHSVVNEFLEYGGSEVINKLLKIMNMILKKGKHITILGKL